MIKLGSVLSLLAMLQAQVELKHLHNVATHFYFPQTFLSSHFQCSNDVSEMK